MSFKYRRLTALGHTVKEFLSWDFTKRTTFSKLSILHLYKKIWLFPSNWQALLHDVHAGGEKALQNPICCNQKVNLVSEPDTEG